MTSLPRRQQEVLRATVRHYVDTVEPVGSRTLVQRFGLPASPATVRSAMGALEQRGLLTQPHTSAGRIPSQRGYRLYVDELLPPPGATARQLERELAGVGLQWAALDDLLLHLARRLADFTGLLSLITRPQRPRPHLQAIRLVRSYAKEFNFDLEFSAQLSLKPLQVCFPPCGGEVVSANGQRQLSFGVVEGAGRRLPGHEPNVRKELHVRVCQIHRCISGPVK